MHSARKASVYIQQSRSEVNGAPSPPIGTDCFHGLPRQKSDFDAPNATIAQQIDDRIDKLIILAKEMRATAGEAKVRPAPLRRRQEFVVCNEAVLTDRIGERKGMRSTKGWGKAAGVIAGLMLAAGLLGWTQFPSREGTPLSRQAAAGDTYNPNSEFEAKRLRALNADRHKAMVSDTEKLVKLARQLDAEIASNPTDEWTPEELRKLETIEKLAHTVKTKMAESFGGGPEIKPILPPPRGLEDQ